MVKPRLLLVLATLLLFKCVNSQDLGILCGVDEVFMPCGSACPPTCSDPRPQVCTFQCAVGCFCRPGLLRDEKTRLCVIPQFCSGADNVDDKGEEKKLEQNFG